MKASTTLSLMHYQHAQLHTLVNYLRTASVTCHMSPQHTHLNRYIQNYFLFHAQDGHSLLKPLIDCRLGFFNDTNNDVCLQGFAKRVNFITLPKFSAPWKSLETLTEHSWYSGCYVFPKFSKEFPSCAKFTYNMTSYPAK